MPRRLESVMRIGRKIGLSDEKGTAAAVFVALIVVILVVAGYYLWLAPPPEEYNVINLLDSHMQASNYPEVLVANQNSTFTVYVNVENHMNSDQNYQVLTKITKNLPANFPDGLPVEPVTTYELNLAKGASSKDAVTVSINDPGSYSVVFELWRFDSGNWTFTNNYCVLNIQVLT
jgi:uncharacterized membrane protein